MPATTSPSLADQIGATLAEGREVYATLSATVTRRADEVGAVRRSIMMFGPNHVRVAALMNAETTLSTAQDALDALAAALDAGMIAHGDALLAEQAASEASAQAPTTSVPRPAAARTTESCPARTPD